MGQLWAVVLAAGEGKRMYSNLPKVLHPICGRPMLCYILDSAAAVSGEVIVVIGHGAHLVREAMGPRWRYVIQEQQLGTGHAVLQAAALLPDEGTVLVLCGDTPLLDPSQLERLLAEHDGNAATVLTAIPPDPDGYGRVIRDENGLVLRIVEDRDASPAEKLVREINTGTYCFDLKLLKCFLPRLSTANKQGEYYLPDIPALMREQGFHTGACRIDDYRIGLGINDRNQLAEAAGLWRGRINRALMLHGVTIVDPGSTYIDYGVRVGVDTIIYPGTVIEGDSAIGSSCRIGPGAHLRDVQVQDRVSIRYAVVEESALETGVTVGPFAYIRPGCRIGPEVKIGDFVEVKNSVLGTGTKVPHLSYVGDADIHDGVNLGAGVIIVNYDGRRKHRSTIGAGAFVGCNSNLISPVEIGAGSFIAAGSTVTNDVPPGALALARAPQENRPGVAGRLLGKKTPLQESEGQEEKK